MKTSRWIGRIVAPGILLFALYIVYGMVRLPSEVKKQLKPLSGLAQQIGGVCYNDGGGEWIDSYVMSNGGEAVTAALCELVSIQEIKVSGCAIGHMRRLKSKKAIPVLAKVAADVENPNHEFAKLVLEELRK